MKAYCLKNLRPAAVWQDALPSGNGKTTALVYGNVYVDKILLNYEKWWYKESTPPLPDFSGCLEKVRTLMDCGKYAEADRIYPDEMLRHTPFAAAALVQPGISLRIESNMEGEYTDYSRTLDMSDALVSVDYKDRVRCKRELFVSRADESVVMRLGGGKGFCGRVWLEPHELENAVGIFGEPFAHGLKFSSCVEDGLMHLKGVRTPVKEGENGTFAVIGNGNDREKRFGAFMRIVGGEVKTIPYSENNLNIMMPEQSLGVMGDGVIFEVSSCNGVTLLLRLYEGEEEAECVKKELLASECDFGKLFERHKKVHGELFARTKVDFAKTTERSSEELLLDAEKKGADAELMNKLYYFGRYLFIIAARENCLPVHLSGKWNGDYFAPWRGVYFLDENSEIIYWQAYSGNMPELLLPLFDLFESQMDDYRENARNMFGCRGIRMPVYVDVFSGHEKDYSPHALYWNGGAAWIASMFYDYYDFTRDKDFLARRAYPFMKEAALFFEDFFVEKDGTLHYYPSTSPENCSLGDFEGAGNISACKDAAMDIALAKNLFGKLLYASELLGVDEYKREEWRDILKKLPKYRINSDGAFAEWICPDFKDNYRHRHLSHLFPVFPGTEIGKSDEELFNASKRALELRMGTGIKEMTGWALAHTANVYAHLNDACGVENCLKLIARHFVGNNLFGYHNNDLLMGVGLYARWCNHAPHQLDVSSGFTSAIHEMICYSHDGTVFVLPAASSFVGDFEASGITLRGGITVELIKRKGRKLILRFVSAEDTDFTVALPAVPSSLFVGGKQVPCESKLNLALKRGKSVSAEAIL